MYVSNSRNLAVRWTVEIYSNGQTFPITELPPKRTLLISAWTPWKLLTMKTLSLNVISYVTTACWRWNEFARRKIGEKIGSSRVETLSLVRLKHGKMTTKKMGQIVDTHTFLQTLRDTQYFSFVFRVFCFARDRFRISSECGSRYFCSYTKLLPPRPRRPTEVTREIRYDAIGRATKSNLHFPASLSAE